MIFSECTESFPGLICSQTPTSNDGLWMDSLGYKGLGFLEYKGEDILNLPIFITQSYLTSGLQNFSTEKSIKLYKEAFLAVVSKKS